MRISTNTLFSIGQSRIGDLQSSLMKIQQQIASGRRILTPADDPIGASQVLNLDQGQAMNQQYASNRVQAGNALREQEGVLASLGDLTQNMKELLAQVGNGALDDQQRGFLAVALDGQFDQLLSLANSKDSLGNYLFSGFSNGIPSYARTPGGASFQGDTGTRTLQVDASRRVTTSTTGAQLFEGIDTGTSASPGVVQNIFATVRQLSDALKSPATTATGQAALNAASSGASNALTTLLDRVLSGRAAVGAQQKEIDALDSAGSARDLEYAQAKSTLQDVDYTKAISDLSQRQITLEAAMKSFKSVSGLSLFALL